MEQVGASHGVAKLITSPTAPLPRQQAPPERTDERRRHDRPRSHSRAEGGTTMKKKIGKNKGNRWQYLNQYDAASSEPTIVTIVTRDCILSVCFHLTHLTLGVMHPLTHLHGGSLLLQRRGLLGHLLRIHTKPSGHMLAPMAGPFRSHPPVLCCLNLRLGLHLGFS